MKRITTVASILLALQAVPAMAQDTASENSTAEDDGRRLSVITVESQRRSQDLQDVPIAVTAVSGEALDEAATATITDLAESIPGLAVVESNRPATSTSIRVRGIGTAGNDAALEGAVGVIIDGVYRPRSGIGLGDFVDLDRVEVLRGPQGTLFGKNTSAGAIIIESNDPIHEFEGSVEATFGNFNLQRYTGVINLPIAEDKFAIRLAGRIHDRDGFVEDSVTGADYNTRDRHVIQAKALFEPTENLSFLLSADIAENTDSCCQSVRFSNVTGSPVLGLFSALAASSGATYPVNPDPTSYSTSINAAPVGKTDDSGVSLEINWDLGDLNLVSTTSKRSFDSDAFNDVDFSGADLVTQDVRFNVDSFSQELRLSGSNDGIGQGLDWLVGAFYSTDEFDQGADVNTGTALAPFFTAAFGGNATLGGLYAAQTDAFGAAAQQDASSFAVFTHNILQITDRLEATVGLRYTEEEKDTVQVPFFNHGVANLPFAGLGLPFAPQHGYDLKFEDDAISGSASLGYEWSDNVRTYVSYSRGFKSGGHVFGRDAAGPLYSANPACSSGNTVAFPAIPGVAPTIFACDPVDPTFNSETVDAYELGLRSRLFDETLLLNATVFTADYDDYQLNSFDGFAFRVQNAGSVNTTGFELESQWLTPVDGLVLNGSFTFIDATYGDEVGSLAAGEPVVGGTALGEAPEINYAVGANYERELFEGVTGRFGLNYSYRDETFTSTRVASDGSELILPSRFTLSLNGGIELENGISVSAFCRNCTDEADPTLIFNSVAQAGSKDVFLTNPAEYGISIGKRF
ncbi:MAG: TonB-dependent receptor [Henriciella sp.]